jgi:ribosomal RNA-processing protein 8
VADMGCGEARLAQVLTSKHDSSRLIMHSFDLVAANPLITRCNIAHVPLADSSVDIVIFCLSLMGTDYHAFLCEAKRILKPR